MKWYLFYSFLIPVMSTETKRFSHDFTCAFRCLTDYLIEAYRQNRHQLLNLWRWNHSRDRHMTCRSKKNVRSKMAPAKESPISKASTVLLRSSSRLSCVWVLQITHFFCLVNAWWYDFGSCLWVQALAPCIALERGADLGHRSDAPRVRCGRQEPEQRLVTPW